MARERHTESMSILAPLFAAALGQAVSNEVPLEQILTDPSRYEGQTVQTGGDAYPGQEILFIKGWISGRSRGGLRMDQTLSEQGYTCLRVTIVRAPIRARPDESGIIRVSHPPVVPEGWQLQVVDVVRLQ